MELRFVQAFLDAGLGLKTIRTCLNYACQVVASDRPFSTSRFRTDGRTIFLESLKLEANPEMLLDLKKHQYAFATILKKSFKDLDVQQHEITRWRPFNGKKSIVVDPHRAFGQPIAAEFGVPTQALAESVEAEGSAKRVASLFEVSLATVRDAVRFESELRSS